MTFARFILILIVTFILIIPNLVVLNMGNESTLVKYRPTILAIFKFSEFMLQSFIFTPFITLFMYPKSIKDIVPSIAIIFWLALILFKILVENSYKKDYLENLSKMKVAESKILHKKHT